MLRVTTGQAKALGVVPKRRRKVKLPPGRELVNIDGVVTDWPIAMPVLRALAWTLAIGGWHPAALNTLMGHHMHRAKLKAHDRDVIGRAVLVYGVPRATGKRRVGLHIVLQKGQRAADSDAYHKSLLDALKHSGAILDDNRQGVELMPVMFSRGESKASFVTLEDVQ